MVPLGIRGWEVPLHSHVSYLWNSDEEFAEAVGFLEAGGNNEHRLLVGSGQAKKRIIDLLAERAVDVEELQASGRITLLDGSPSPEDFLDSIAAVFRKAIAGGASLIRFLGVPAWGEQGWPDDASLLAFEGRVTRFARRFPSPPWSMRCRA
jgi:DcmR-like sensory protein